MKQQPLCTLANDSRPKCRCPFNYACCNITINDDADAEGEIQCEIARVSSRQIGQPLFSTTLTLF